ncbi:SH3-like domain-containing protein [Hyphomicrobium sp.]|jgi:nitrile hydratase|uniref:SH3-like domain-containing protein n=1 Tax=Hyphomicrobium sp. TaxID=82 RepID=UPI003561A308
MAAQPSEKSLHIVTAFGEQPVFKIGDRVRVADRAPIGHYRVPRYLRKKLGGVEAVIEPAFVDNEEEGYGRNAGSRRHYYRIAFPMTELWPDYAGSPKDGLRIEVFESWLERV